MLKIKIERPKINNRVTVIKKNYIIIWPHNYEVNKSLDLDNGRPEKRLRYTMHNELTHLIPCYNFLLWMIATKQLLLPLKSNKSL